MTVYKAIVSTLMVLFMGMITWFAVKNRYNRPTFMGFLLMDILQLMALTAIWG